MATWATFIESGGDVARVAADRLLGQVSYLATVRRNGAPRVHPVSTLVHDGQLFVRMYPTSPKVKDLLRDPRYSLHSQVEDSEGTGGEVSVSGVASMMEDDDWIVRAFEGISDPDPERYVVFTFDVENVRVTLYPGEETVRKSWSDDR